MEDLNNEIGFEKVYCEHDEHFRIKHKGSHHTVNWIEFTDGTVVWLSPLVSGEEDDEGNIKTTSWRYIGWGCMSEKQIDIIIDDLNESYRMGHFKNHKPKRLEKRNKT